MEYHVQTNMAVQQIHKDFPQPSAVRDRQRSVFLLYLLEKQVTV